MLRKVESRWLNSTENIFRRFLILVAWYRTLHDNAIFGKNGVRERERKEHAIVFEWGCCCCYCKWCWCCWWYWGKCFGALLLLLALRNSRTLKHLKTHELCTIMVTGNISSKLSPVSRYKHTHAHTHFFFLSTILIHKFSNRYQFMDGAYLIQKKKCIFP